MSAASLSQAPSLICSLEGRRPLLRQRVGLKATCSSAPQVKQAGEETPEASPQSGDPFVPRPQSEETAHSPHSSKRIKDKNQGRESTPGRRQPDGARGAEEKVATMKPKDWSSG